MTVYIAVCADDPNDAVEIPVENDNTVLMSTVAAQFPNATGLKYKPENGKAFRGLRQEQDKIQLPEDTNAHDQIYFVVYPKGGLDQKRKVDTGGESAVVSGEKRARVDGKTMDLIVLGLRYSNSEEDVRGYFEQFGEITVCEVKKDTSTGQSRGFGFIRFADLAVQRKVLKQGSHLIDGRRCEVKIPETKSASGQVTVSKKIFVGSVPEAITEEDLEEHFSQFGRITDLYLPKKPHRYFAFITFEDADIAHSLYGSDQTVSGHKLEIKPASVKKTKEDAFGPPDGGFGSFDRGFGGGMPTRGGRGGGRGGYGNVGGPGGPPPMMGNGMTGSNFYPPPSQNGPNMFGGYGGAAQGPGAYGGYGGPAPAANPMQNNWGTQQQVGPVAPYGQPQQPGAFPAAQQQQYNPAAQQPFAQQPGAGGYPQQSGGAYPQAQLAAGYQQQQAAYQQQSGPVGYMQQQYAQQQQPQQQQQQYPTGQQPGYSQQPMPGQFQPQQSMLAAAGQSQMPAAGQQQSQQHPQAVGQQAGDPVAQLGALDMNKAKELLATMLCSIKQESAGPGSDSGRGGSAEPNPQQQQQQSMPSNAAQLASIAGYPQSNGAGDSGWTNDSGWGYRKK